MAVDAILGLGTRNYYSSNGTDYNEFVDMVLAGPPDDPTYSTIEATPLNPTDRAREFLKGLVDYGEYGFSQYYNKTRFDTLRDNLGTNLYWRVTLPDDSKFEFRGIITKAILAGLETEKVITIDVKVKITGAVVFTPAA